MQSQKQQILQYSDRETLAYTAGQMPGQYAMAWHALDKIKRDFQPQSILDFGTGTGACLW